MLRTALALGIVLPAVLCLAACGGGNATVAEKPAPIVTEVQPASGGVSGGTSLTITGRNFTNRGLGITEVLVAGRVATKVVVRSDSEITCATPEGILGSASVSVTKNHGTGVMDDAFRYYPPPELTDVEPNEGSRDGGLLVTVRGKDFQDTEPGETRVLFGGIPGTFLTILDDETIEVTTPAVPFEKLTSVTVENFNGSSTLPTAFTFRGPLPVLLSISPETGVTGGGTVVTITGDLFSTRSIPYFVTFGDLPGNAVTRVSDTEITCASPTVKQTGPVEVRVGNNNGTAVDSATFTYFAPPSSVSSIEPTSGFADETTPVTIFGIGFEEFDAGTPTVTFGTTSALDIVVVDDTTITCDAPALPSGVVDVTVTNNRGTDTIEEGFEYLWIPVWETDYGTKQTLSGGLDEGNATIDIEFNVNGSTQGFEFYGEEWDECFADANGYVNFDAPNPASYSAVYGSNPQINICGGDMWGESTAISNSGVYAKTEDELITITYNGISWWPSNGYVVGQVQFHVSGAWALLYDSINFGNGNTMSVGCCPASPYTGVSVDWASEQTFTDEDNPSQNFSSTLSLLDKAVTFYPDGSGGYSTRVYNLD